MIFMILIGATIFGYYMAMSQIPQHVVAAVTALDLNRWVVIAGIVVAYFVVSMFMDELPLLLLTLQLTFPLDRLAGFRPDLVRRPVDADGVDGARLPAGGHDRLRGQLQRQREPREGLHGHEHPDDRARPDHGAHHGLPADRPLAPVHHAVIAHTTSPPAPRITPVLAAAPWPPGDQPCQTPRSTTHTPLPTDDGGLPAYPAAASQLRLMAARSSNDFACWPRAMVVPVGNTLRLPLPVAMCRPGLSASCRASRHPLQPVQFRFPATLAGARRRVKACAASGVLGEM